MPYKAKGKCVYRADIGKKVGCTKGPVSKYLAALHANVPDAKNEEVEEPMKIKLSEIAKKIMEGKGYYTPNKGITLNGRAIDPKSIEIDGVDPRDYPDFSDAYISAASYVGGGAVSEEDLPAIEDQNYGLTNDLAHGNYLEEGEEEEFRRGGKMAYQWHQTHADREKMKTCPKCHKKYVPDEYRYSECPVCGHDEKERQ